jgi:hypothetical protein
VPAERGLIVQSRDFESGQHGRRRGARGTFQCISSLGTASGFREISDSRGAWKVIHRTLSIYDYNWLPVYYIAVGEQNVV